MSFAPHTPEALLPRSDSKNPATTCKGITTNGRTCRRSLGYSPSSSPGSSPLRYRGVLAVHQDGQDDENPAAFYCWQHKDQAERVAMVEQNHTELFPVQERSSIDTLVDRVGVMNLTEDTALNKAHHKRTKTSDGRSRAKKSLPRDWQRMQGPVMSVPSDMMNLTRPAKPQWQTQPSRSNVKASLLCCVRDVSDDEYQPARHRPRPARNSAPDRVVEIRQKSTLPAQASSGALSPMPGNTTPVTPNRTTTISPGLGASSTPTRPNLATTPQSTGSQTQGLLSFIPSCLSPQTTSILLNELSKPISTADAEGYIYMFWLTPESDNSKPDEEAASELLEARTDHPSQDRRRGDVLQRYASQRKGSTQQTKTVLLKIGRAENVHRRLSQWSKQCSYNITLIRYYPYTPARNPPHLDVQTLPKKVPHVHRVERLIHVELAEKRVTEQGPCKHCGREHREWFEVEASRDGLRAVDSVVRRWVAWAERQE